MMDELLARYAIGIDIGGTKIAGGVVNVDNGEILWRKSIPTLTHRGGEAVLADCITLIEELIQVASIQAVTIKAVGIGLCELVDPAGNVKSAYNFDWRNLPVIERLSQIAPTVIDADVRVAARAEARYGAGQSYQNFAYVTVGTGISATLVQQGEPWSGTRGNALVLATMPLTTTCTHCGTRLDPVLEEFASGPALVKRYNQQTAQKAISPASSGQDVFAAVAQGDSDAIEIVTSAGEALGTSMAFLCNVLDPAAVVVGGGLGLAGGLYWEHFVESTRHHIYAEETRQLPILPAALGVDAGIIGAAATFLSERTKGPKH